jgi:hypothetical protein
MGNGSNPNKGTLTIKSQTKPRKKKEKREFNVILQHSILFLNRLLKSKGVKFKISLPSILQNLKKQTL